ncbi:MAG: hypothetical protein WAS93_07950 [Burkholderiaceae bacterium]
MNITVTFNGTTYANFGIDDLRVAGVPDADINQAVGVELAKQIDDAAEAVYKIASRFGDEYKAREAAAIAYKTAAYKGDVSSYISSFAQSAGMSNQQATDTIVAQSVAFRGALEALGALRMQKFAVRALAETDVNAAQTKTEQIIAQMRAIGSQL